MIGEVDVERPQPTVQAAGQGDVDRLRRRSVPPLVQDDPSRIAGQQVRDQAGPVAIGVQPVARLASSSRITNVSIAPPGHAACQQWAGSGDAE